jgi:DeoR/GlpR family transcriptional regulator of sugar metabolism
MTERHTKILEALADRRRIEVAVLAKMLEVSQVTVRKDLDSLEARGFIRREHGFASLETVDDAGRRLAFRYTIKQRIARAAAEMIKDGETVMLESGSCCALLAEELMNNKRDITIVTNSVFVANHVRYAPHGKLILLGGYYQDESQVLVGSITRKCAEIFFAEKFFIGAGGFTETIGFTGKDHQRAQTIQALSEQATRIIVLTESEKFRSHGVVGLIKVEEVADVFTDDKIPWDAEKFLEGKNVKIHKVLSAAYGPPGKAA